MQTMLSRPDKVPDGRPSARLGRNKEGIRAPAVRGWARRRSRRRPPATVRQAAPASTTAAGAALASSRRRRTAPGAARPPPTGTPASRRGPAAGARGRPARAGAGAQPARAADVRLPSPRARPSSGLRCPEESARRVQEPSEPAVPLPIPTRGGRVRGARPEAFAGAQAMEEWTSRHLSCTALSALRRPLSPGCNAKLLYSSWYVRVWPWRVQ